MKIVEETTSIEVDVVNRETGEVVQVPAIKTTYEKNYSIRSLNAKVSIMKFGEAQSKICHSQNDVMLFWLILDAVDKHNEFRKNVTKFAESVGVNGSTVRRMLKRGVDVGFFARPERGVYVVNPFLFKAKGASNETIEELQKNWNSIVINQL